MLSIIRGYLKFLGVIALAIASLYAIYYSFWFICLLDNVCYSRNFGV